MSMDFLSNIADKMQQTKAEIDLLNNDNQPVEKIIKIDHQDIGNWEFRDRQNFELGDIEALSESILLNGQAQPIVVVVSDNVFKSVDNKNVQYIVIAGYRRWLACKNKNIPVDAIVRKLNFEQAIACLVSENEKEKVSDYSKGMFYYNVLKKEKITKKALYDRLMIHRSVFDNYLSFADVPSKVWDAVKNMGNVSARTASTIKLICQKGKEETDAIVKIADKIASGIGEKKIRALVSKILKEENIVSEGNATRVAFKENIFIDVKKDGLIVTLKKIDKEHVHNLKERFMEILDNYFEKAQ